MSERLARDIAALAELFKAGGWRELRMEAEGISLLFSTDPGTAGLEPAGSPHPAQAELVEALPFTSAEKRKDSPSTSSGRTDVGGKTNPSWGPVIAPNLGTFYRSPKPGAPPFVEFGQRVTAETEICLLEVMKLFTSVKAGTAGTIRRICAGDGELVAGGQILFYIEPE